MKVVKVVAVESAVENVEDVDPLKDQGHVLLPKWTDFKDPFSKTQMPTILQRGPPAS